MLSGDPALLGSLSDADINVPSPFHGAKFWIPYLKPLAALAVQESKTPALGVPSAQGSPPCFTCFPGPAVGHCLRGAFQESALCRALAPEKSCALGWAQPHGFSHFLSQPGWWWIPFY